ITEDLPANRQLDDERLALVRATLKNRQHNLELAVSLKDYPRGQASVQITPDVLSTLLEHAQDCRLPFFLLRFDVESLLQEGRQEEAAVRIHAILNAGAGLRQDFFLISQLVRMAGRGVAAQATERLLGMADVGDDDL